MDELRIGGAVVGEGEPPYVIAEIGANHNGDMALCRRLVDAAVACGVDAVKFQSWSSTSLIGRAEYRRNAQYNGNNGAPTLEAAVAKYALSPAQHRQVAAYCREVGATFLSSCFAPEEVDLLESLGAPAYKVASMDVNHLPLLRYVAGTGKPVFLSTGMATLGEVERALDELRANGSGPVALLHCAAIYPCPPDIVSLRTMDTWRRAFDVPVGFSDHTLGNAVALGAVALGACAVEKHFTVDTALDGWDHGISADPATMRALVDGARAVYAALGTTRRVVPAVELEKRKVFRRRIVARRAARAGERLGEADVDFKRPGTGIGPEELPYVVGRTLVRDVAPDEELEWTHFA